MSTAVKVGTDVKSGYACKIARYIDPRRHHIPRWTRLRQFELRHDYCEQGGFATSLLTSC